MEKPRSPEDANTQPGLSPADSNDKSVPKRKHDFIKNFIAAFISSLVAETLMCPVDRVKLIFQVQALRKTIATDTRHEVHAGRGIFACLRIIISQQGFFGLWRGHSATILQAIPNQALTFALKDKLTLVLSQWFGKNKTPVRAFMIGCMSGSIAGACMTSLLYPLEYAKTNMAADMSKKGKSKRGTILAVLASTYRNFGIGAVYRGLPFSVLGIIIYRGCYFGIFDLGMKLAPIQYRPTVTGQILPAFTASMVASFVAYPMDTVRRNMMLRKHREGKESLGHVARKIYAKTGIRGFYAGSAVNLFRSIGGGVMLVSYTTIKSALASF